jgi:hypothetical protein
MTTRAAPDPASDPPHPFSEKGLARLMLSTAYQEIAETALNGMVPSTGLESPGARIESARHLGYLAEEVLRWAVVYERECGASWEDIGDALGPITRQSAHRRFAEQVEQWRAPFDEPETVRLNGTADDPRIPYPARDPDATAENLDQWLRNHTSPRDGWAEEPHPISAHLDRYTTTDAWMMIQNYTGRLLRDQVVPDPQKEADALDLRVALLERLVREGDAPPEASTWIAQDRARAVALRQTPGHGVTWDEFSSTDSPEFPPDAGDQH